jgi:Tfp pilus assembly protein PilO
MHEPLPTWHRLTSLHLLILAVLVTVVLGWLVHFAG